MRLLVDLRLRAGVLSLRACFEAQSGITILMGPSASGKTLLLRALAGLDPIESGRVLFGEPIMGAEPYERGIGYAPQDPSLWPHLKVRDHLSPFCDSSRVFELAKRLSIDELLDRKPASLSGGERQRVSLARALAAKPKWLLLDEPTSALDRSARGRVGQVLREEIKESGATAILVTHDDHEASALGDSHWRVENGEIVRDKNRQYFP